MRVNVTLINIPVRFYTEQEKIPTVIRKHSKTPNSHSNLKQKSNAEGITIADLKL